MSSNTKQRVLGISMFTALFLAVAFLAVSGCYIEDGYYYEEDEIHLADLQVDWTIKGADSAALCGVYGIKGWVVEAHGPETRTSLVNCAKYFWSTEGDFALMAEGDYVITIRAMDSQGREIAALSSPTPLYYDGHTQTLHFDFLPTDFGF